ncbi:MAG: hypothetical protein GY870_09100 [archaeon]|nr:hypothetical protein [archaeon]
MKYLFPVKHLYNFSKKYVLVTWIVFVLFFLLSNYIGPPPIFAKNFFYPSESYIWKLFFKYMDIIHTRASSFLIAIIFNTFEFWIIYLISGLKKSFEFKVFVLPFISYAFIGVFLRLLEFLPGVQIFTPPIGIAVTVYFSIYFAYVLINIYSLKPIKSVLIVLVAFLLERVITFLLFGPTVGMILQELNV